MNVVTILWTLTASCALLFAAVHVVVWLFDRRASANLALSAAALSLVFLVFVEMAMMASLTVQEWGEWLRWIHPPLFILIISILMFFKLHLQTGRTWLIWIIVAMRALVLVLNFTSDPNFNFERIDSIVRAPFLGELVTMPGETVASSSQWIATVAMLLMLFYMGDALATLWRTGKPGARRTVITLSGAMLVSVAAATLVSQLTIFGVFQLPAMISLPFFVLVCAMALEMSQGMLRASRLADELRESESRLELAADSAGLGLWSWDARKSQIWSTTRTRNMFEFSADESVTPERLGRLVHTDDLAPVHDVLQRAAAMRTVQEVTFRVRIPNGGTRWILARGRSEAEPSGKLTAIQGVLRDVTDQLHMLRENEQLRRDLTHTERVTVLGRLSSSLAHELSQPLTAILHNTEAAQILLQAPTPDLNELREIVADVQRDDLRAADIIAGMRAMFTRHEMTLVPLPVATLLDGVLSLLRNDVNARHVRMDSNIEPDIPAIRGDRVHLSQVLLNILMNAMDAVADLPEGQRRVMMDARSADSGCVEITIADSGPGVADDVLQRIFEPFFTTKSTGMGMGLSVSRQIVEMHNGKLWAENCAGTASGATFRITLPVFEPSPC